MSAWPQVEAIPYALETLSTLHPTCTICLATNAADSTEAEIRLALARVDLDPYLDRVYCFRKIGYKKPLPEFFNFILEDLALLPSQVVMIGDDYDADILGALHSGLHAVWLHPRPSPQPSNLHLQIIPDLSLLPSALHNIFA
jgi:putative hydrolase of the HAD superfamily